MEIKRTAICVSNGEVVGVKEMDIQEYTAWVKRAIRRGYEDYPVNGKPIIKFLYRGNRRIHNPNDFEFEFIE